jgi:hypothetical protein
MEVRAQVVTGPRPASGYSLGRLMIRSMNLDWLEEVLNGRPVEILGPC